MSDDRSWGQRVTDRLKLIEERLDKLERRTAHRSLARLEATSKGPLTPEELADDPFDGPVPR